MNTSNESTALKHTKQTGNATYGADQKLDDSVGRVFEPLILKPHVVVRRLAVMNQLIEKCID
jgi:hypothetical protein